MIQFVKSIQVRGTLAEKLVYKPYPKDQFKLYNWYVKVLSVAFDSRVDTNLMCNITCNYVTAEEYISFKSPEQSVQSLVESREQVLQSFKLITKANDGGVVRFTNSEWFFMNERPSKLIFHFQNLKTNKPLQSDINVYVTVALGQQM